MKKQDRHEAIRDRAREAIGNLYHNATPSYPHTDTDAESEAFQSWFEFAASCEIEYIQDGGAYGSDYAATLRHPANAGKFKSERAREYYVYKGLRTMREERARCNNLDSRSHLTNALWERIGEYGTLYQYGRGGRTLAPDNLVSQRGGSSFAVRTDYADALPIADVIDLIRIVESFNRHVADWCKSAPELWREEWAERQDETAEIAAETLEASRPDLYPSL